MANKHPSRDAAQTLYVFCEMSQKEVAENLQLTTATVNKWAEQDNWKALRQAYTLSPDRLIKLYYEQSEEIVTNAKQQNRTLDSKEADTLVKLAAAIERLDKKTNPPVVMSVIKQLVEYIKPVDPDFASKLVSYASNYLKTIS